MENHKVELLAPAGNYDSFIGAINAGADAVYVGGEKFSARAFADNFDTDTLCNCIEYAHLFGRKVYLTLNTLIKENEFCEIYDYVKPFYEAGLDGVIVQDFGVLRFLKQHFPHMELHASTQMAVTGPEFMEMCKKLGVSRVVPARELSLQELKAIRDAGIEVECFIHGAMCYCYSGMCLMSSILGGRSGNRGKCAQPCRLPYQVSLDGKTKSDTYTLSLKDMCTIEHVAELIKAGMDSFKIEGRMKRSEYAAGVTALYRKYIDQYYANPEKEIHVTPEDKRVLEQLYMRSELHDGYLHKHNGKEMVTHDAPSYQGLDEQILMDIRERYLGYTQKIKISVYGYFQVGQPSTLTVFTEDGDSITVEGPVVETANKTSATEEAVAKQISKLGNTHFELKDLEITVEGNAFLPNGVLNALRRDAVEQLRKQIISRKFPEIALRKANTNSYQESMPLKSESHMGVSVLLQNEEQFMCLMQHPFLHSVETLYLEEASMEAYLNLEDKTVLNSKVVYAMPYILRGKDTKQITEYLLKLFRSGIRSVLVRNVEELALVHKLSSKYDISMITDASLYCWNRQSKDAFREFAQKVTLPFELNSKELRCLRGEDTEQVVYGYIPLMITANCIYKTNGTCQLSTGQAVHMAELKDRYGKVFHALTNCKYCYNTIYNSVPLSLHKKYNQSVPGSIRLQFSLEEKSVMKSVLDYYYKWIQGEKGVFPIEEYTTAHENRQVD